MNNKKKFKINIGQLSLLAILATSFTKRDDEQEFKPWAESLRPDIVNSKAFGELVEDGLVDEKGVPTQAGMKLVLNGTSFTPNLEILAKSDFSAAVKMIVTGYDALKEKVAATETGQIMPKRNENGEWEDTRLVSKLLEIQAWIGQVTATYTASLQPTPAPKKAAKA